MRGQYSHQSNSGNSAAWTRIILGLGALIFIILIIRFISGGSTAATLETAAASLRLPDTTSSAQITNADNKEKEVNANTPLAPMDFIEVKSGTAQVGLLANEKNSLNLNAGTKLRYLQQTSDNKAQFRLENKDMWVQSDTSSMAFDLMGITVTPASTTVMNVSKNELFTTITVLQGSATIALGGATQEITAGKQLNYSSLKTLTAEDISSRITSINPDSLSSDWMKQNGASAYLGSTTSGSDTSAAAPGTGSAGSLILFEYPVDESTIEGKVVTVSGRILAPTVSRVVINGTPATVDPAKQTFSLSNVTLTAKENNLIYRTYDTAGALLSKGIITVYSTALGATGSNTAATPGAASARAQVETYKPDSRFKIVAPSTDFFETRETKVKIEGKVTAGVAHHITVNDFKLGSFSPNGTSWYYFANQQFDNLQEGVNTYTIRYFDAQDNELYKQLFVIKKLSATTTPKPITTITPLDTTTTGTDTSAQ